MAVHVAFAAAVVGVLDEWGGSLAAAAAAASGGRLEGGERGAALETERWLWGGCVLRGNGRKIVPEGEQPCAQAAP